MVWKYSTFGKKVLVTRDKRQAREFSDKIEKIGGFAIELPFIKIESTLDKIDREMLKSYSTLLFNSLMELESLWIKLKILEI